MEIKKIKYPSDDYYHFGMSEGAVSINDKKIEEWINEGIQQVKQQLENGIESPYSYHASGDSIVIVFFSQDVGDDVFNDDNYFVVIVAKNYEEAEYFISDIKEDDGHTNLIEDVSNQTIEYFIDNLGEGKKTLKVGKYTIKIESDDD